MVPLVVVILKLKFDAFYVVNPGEMIMGRIKMILFELLQRVRVDLAFKFGVPAFHEGLKC